MYHKVLVFALTRKAYSVRSAAQRRVKRIISSLGGCKMALAFIQELRLLLANQKVCLHCAADQSEELFALYS
jgi:hypothetical protein